MRVIGPTDLKLALRQGRHVISTVSHAPADWQRELSPFFLGPVPLYDGMVSRCMENAWQYAKVYPQHASPEGDPSAEYWEWAKRGWARSAVRYPMGKGAKPLYLKWGPDKLPYLAARHQVYWPLYQTAVQRMPGYARLKELHAHGPLTLFDFDGYDHDALGLSLAEVSTNLARPMGHAFILKAMLLYGDDVLPTKLPSAAQQPLF